jgi:hypothetical protein
VKHVGIGVGIDMIERIDSARAVVDRLGFRMGKPPHYFPGDIDTIALYPKDNCLPVYNRDAVLFTGNLSDLEQWIKGIDWARQYDSYLGVASEQRRAQYETKEIARQERAKYNKAKAETFETLKKEHA